MPTAYKSLQLRNIYHADLYAAIKTTNNSFAEFSYHYFILIAKVIRETRAYIIMSILYPALNYTF